ncbi:MAG: TetR/AcrR family transcriptional regulator [Acidimicrobiia bacterium]
MDRREQIIASASSLLELEGPDGLTMRAIADDLGIRAPSLYKHIANKHELEVALVSEALTSQAEAFKKAVTEGDDPVTAIASAYRRWALAHPHLYALMNNRSLPRDDIADGIEGRSVAPVLEAFGGDRQRARAAWAFAHGMVTLELADRFPPGADIDQTWRIGISSIKHSHDPTEGSAR